VARCGRQNAKLADPVFDSEGSLTGFLEGDVKEADPQNVVVKPLASTGDYRYFRMNGNGRIMTLHANGYPKSYKTIVKNRLFGRQMEWDENGKVISDDDYDIPQPWADAPKKQ
jgi:antitoxin component YwqK of YwqJK toxin-antitoxin module